jgi:hypothetical protein
MAIVTVGQYSAYSGRDFSPAQIATLERMIQWAEGWLRRAAGYVFYDENATESPASQDWIEAVCLIVERLWYQDGEEEREAIYSPFQTERQSDYSYTVAADRALDIGTDPRIAQILAQWKGAIGGDAGPVLMIVEGPTRNLIAEYDPDLQLFGGDVSRGAFWGDEEP